MHLALGRFSERLSQKELGLLSNQCIGTTTGRGFVNFFNSSIALLGDVVNNPIMGTARTFNPAL